MRIISAEYCKSYPHFNTIDLPLRPAVAFIGRSNVGKSSLINRLVARRHLVKTSSTPGKTQLINFFLINDRFYFVDLPGYGFAEVPVAVKSAWQKMIQDFLRHYPGLRLVVQLVDIRHPPSRFDVEFHENLKALGMPCRVVANKADKVGRNQLSKALAVITRTLVLNSPPLPHSALKGTGQTEIWRVIEEQLALDVATAAGGDSRCLDP
jgi:GTP-binding protein